jgi:hypothetical protein
MHISLVVLAVFALIAAIVLVSTLLLNVIKAVTEPKHSGDKNSKKNKGICTSLLFFSVSTNFFSDFDYR